MSISAMTPREGKAVAAPVPGGDTATLTVLFGSQTGNAEYLAHQIHGRLESDGVHSEVSSLEDWLHGEDLGIARLLVVTATHDMGHMPDNAQEFWDWLMSLAPGSLDGLPYAVLSIGDSMYDDFCKAGHDIDERLSQLGARRIVEGVDCDIDFEFSAQKWAGSAVESLLAAEPWQPKTAIAPPGVANGAIGGDSRSAEIGYEARVVDTRALSKPGSDKRVMHYELAFDGEPFDYQPGDSIAVYPLNDEALVDEWMGVFDETLFDGPRALRDVLRADVELRLPHPGLIVALARRLPQPSAAADIVSLVESGDRDKLDSWLWSRDVLDVVTEMGGRDLPIRDVLEHLRPIQHRDYSISSSPLADDGRVHITVREVDFAARGREYRGTATSFLAQRAAVGEVIPVRRLPAHDFRLPADDVPVIMIGPGVGVAPFRAFLRHRDALGASGRNWLFFGDRHRATDWLYEEEFVELHRRGVLDRLDVAFSRDQAEKVYVQHRMLAQADDLRTWIEEGASVYVCGDKSTMAPDVEKAMMDIVGGSEALGALKSSGRYVKDVY